MEDVAAEADRIAQETAERRGLRIVELFGNAEHTAAGELLRVVWGADSADVLVNASTMRAFVHSGNYVAGAYAGAELVGVAVAFRGAGHLHSHIAGVLAHARGSGVGYALKLHQRAWSLRQRIAVVAWTFDPLVRRNAIFNLRKLGADATAYLTDFYGIMDDGVNSGEETDRLYVRWRLDSPAAIAAARGVPHDPGGDGAPTLLRCSGDEPVSGDGVLGDDPLLLEVPADIEALRERAPGSAARWRPALRAAMTGAISAGYAIAGIRADGRYVLRPAVPAIPS